MHGIVLPSAPGGLALVQSAALLAQVAFPAPCPPGPRVVRYRAMARTKVEQHQSEAIGDAGYVTPYPYLEKLQEKMEERLAKRVPATGRFCGFCYGRLRDTDAECPFCAHAIAAAGTVSEIPQPVLRAYKARKDTEARWVYGMGFVGLILASVLFIALELWGPGPLGNPATGLAVLILGGYVLAQFFGTLIGAQIGFRSGSKKRDLLWGEYLARRDQELPPQP